MEILTIRPLFIELGSHLWPQIYGRRMHVHRRTLIALARFCHLPPEELERAYSGTWLSAYYPTGNGECSDAGVEMAVGIPRCMQVAAWTLVCSKKWRHATRIILLGREVGRPFGFVRTDPYCHWQEWGYWKGRRVAMIPHPCGGSEWWKNTERRTEISNFIRETAGLDRLPVQQSMALT